MMLSEKLFIFFACPVVETCESFRPDKAAPITDDSIKIRHKETTDINDAAHPFFNYTSGRWL